MRTILFLYLFMLSASCCQKVHEQSHRVINFLHPSGVRLQTTDYHLAQAWREMKEFYGVYKTAENLVIGKDGQAYGKITQYFDKFEWDLNSKLMQPEFAKKISLHFSKLITPFTNKNLTNELKNFLLEHSFILGSKKINGLAFIEKIDSKLFFEIEKISGLKENISEFFANVSSFYCKEEIEDKNEKKILIIETTAFGGGHHTSAMAISAQISKTCPNCNVQVIDTKEANSYQDPFYILTSGLFHSDNIYDKILQQRSDPYLAYAYWAVLGDLRQYFIDESLVPVQNLIENFQPNLLLNCIHHRPEYVSLAFSRDKKMWIVSTDYELQPNLYPIILKNNSDLLSVLTTTTHRLFFEGLYAHCQKDLGNIAFSCHSLDSFMKRQITFDNFSKKMPVFKLMGIPIREEIYEDRSSSLKLQTRNKYHVREHAKLGAVAMGRQGAGSTLDIVEKVIKDEKKLEFDLDIAVLCGTNSELKNSLEKLSRTQASSRVRIFPLGLLSASEMNEIYNSVDFLISKPGGATSRELLEVNLPLLVYGTYDWEKANLRFLKGIGLAQDSSDFKSLAEGIEFMVKNFSQRPNLSFEKESWKENLSILLNDV